MSIYKKLQQSRVKLQSVEMKKSGHNKFAGYYYFELGDFLNPINKIFNEMGLCGITTFTSNIATLTIYDVEDGSNVVFTSPMGSAALKGCHEVQNIGAVETYQRRYLYVVALEIVEHDALESVTGKQEKEQPIKVSELHNQNYYDTLNLIRDSDSIETIASHLKSAVRDGASKNQLEELRRVATEMKARLIGELVK